MFDLSGKRALVTGASGGIGAATARALHGLGAAVALSGTRGGVLEELAVELGDRAHVVVCDLTDAQAANALAGRASDAMGGLDILVNNAVWPHGEGPLADANLEDWRTAMEVNFLGAMTMTQAAIPALRRRTAARIIMVSTIASREHYAMAGPYASSKAALNAVTKTLARELGPDGIRVNAVIPGWIWGPTAQGVLKQWGEAEGVSLDDMRIRYEQQTALHYLPDAEEVAKVAVFLASELSNPVTGHLLDANAGQWM
jgi:3-oxoacyl-[acyl-carrier protein] reductase